MEATRGDETRQPYGSRANDETWLDVAHRIGRRIAGEALWSGEVCTWSVETLDRENGTGRSHAVTADGKLYQGSAGIALFLGELAAETGDEAVRRAAAGGARHALADAESRPRNAFGFHTGRTGVAWVAARLGDRLGDPELSRRSLQLLTAMDGHEHQDAGFDVIAGAAGAVAPLLDLADGFGRPQLAAMAERLGERLLATARREPDGWSWGTVGPAITRNLVGLGHGACGIGTALLELAAARRRGDFRFAAEMAYLYERRLFHAGRSNWPDLRHTELNLIFYDGGPEAVRRADEAGEVDPYVPSYMAAWCHGAPGAGLARLRAWELTGQAVYRREAELALGPTLESLGPPPTRNYSLCHGVGGNCELPWAAGRAWGRPELLEICHAVAEHGRRTFEDAGRPWPCGTAGAVRDPSLMLGEAGIGWFYLRLARPRLPSPLLPRPRRWQPVDRAAEDGGWASLAAGWVESRFGAARVAFGALGAPAEDGVHAATAGAAAATEPPDRSPVEVVFEALSRGVAAAEEPRRRLLDDAFRPQRRRHEMEALPNDLTEEYRRRLRRAAVGSVDWTPADGSALRLRPAPELEVVETEHDWAGWLASRQGAAGGASAPDLEPRSWILARLGDRVVLRPVGGLAAAVLKVLLAAPEGVALDDLVDGIAARLGGDDEPDAGRRAVAAWEQGARERLRRQVAAQAEALYRIGLLDAEPASLSPDASWPEAG
jgi:hypothetical protein